MGQVFSDATVHCGALVPGGFISREIRFKMHLASVVYELPSSSYHSFSEHPSIILVETCKC